MSALSANGLGESSRVQGSGAVVDVSLGILHHSL